MIVYHVFISIRQFHADVLQNCSELLPNCWRVVPKPHQRFWNTFGVNPFPCSENNTPRNHETFIFMNTALFMGNESVPSNNDLIWQLGPIRGVKSARTLNIVLSWLLEQVDSYHQKHNLLLQVVDIKPIVHIFSILNTC